MHSFVHILVILEFYKRYGDAQIMIKDAKSSTIMGSWQHVRRRPQESV
jgi:hypothetical protein